MILLLIIAVLPIGGFLIGYFVGRKAGRRQATQGFPVLPPANVPAAGTAEIQNADKTLK